MSAAALVAATALLLAVGAGLLRAARGPSDADRMLALQLLHTGVVAALLILREGLAIPRLLDLALVLAALGAVTSVVFVVAFAPPSRPDDGPSP